jgi:acetylornithine deacetylase/succinyl-diaminopimelate desuccinylase-like protein
MNHIQLEQQIDEHINAHLDYWIEQLARLCAQPSISAQGLGITECAALVADILREQDYEAEIMPTGGHPVVYAESNHSDSNGKTLLFYLHYDVQPPEPLELWGSPPFTLTRIEDRLVARGVTDDKGHIIARLAALAAVRDCAGGLPCRIKFIIEGEEELGSPHLPPFIEQQREKLAADACIWEFGSVNYADAPLQTLGMRGLCYVELSVKTATMDAHSGLGGSIFPNAAWRLVWALNTIKDREERILIPGFYENVRPPTPRDLELLDACPDEAQELLQAFGLRGFLKGLTGGLPLRQAAVFEPTCTICGLTAGYQGGGPKTVLPAEARAKIDFRLVPEQMPEEIVPKLRAHLDLLGFEDVEITFIGGVRPAKVDPDHPFVQLTNQAARDVYGIEPVVEPIIGGSGPNYPFIHVLGLPVVSAGIGYPGGRAHAPNENIRIGDFINGTRHTARIITRFGEWGLRRLEIGD